MAMIVAVDLDSARLSPEAGRPALGPRHAAWWIELLRALEHGGVTLATIADEHRPGPGAGEPAGRLDAVMVALRAAPATERIGIVPAASATLSEPFLLSTQIATLDWVSGGRGGWEVQVSTRADDGAYVGPRRVPPVADRHEEAGDHVEVVRRLWDSWEDGAAIRDVARHRFIDAGRVHHIDFRGRWFDVTGPSITPRPPQGQPIVAVGAGDGPSQQLAASCADVVFVAGADEPTVAGRTLQVSEAAGAAGRDPAQLRLLAEVTVAVDADRARARERALRARDRGRATLSAAGAPAAILADLAAWAADLGIDGFRLHPAALPGDLVALARQVVPELAPRGPTLTQAATLRERLGLARPVNRYDAA